MGCYEVILLDTHTLLWLMSADSNLGEKSKALIDNAYHDTHNPQSHQLAVSAISFWEVSLLKQKSRIEFSDDIANWRKELLRQGVKEIEINGDVAIHSTNLKDFHADPADRFIVSSALHNDATLITADKKILDWKGDLKTFDARQ